MHIHVSSISTKPCQVRIQLTVSVQQKLRNHHFIPNLLEGDIKHGRHPHRCSANIFGFMVTNEAHDGLWDCLATFRSFHIKFGTSSSGSHNLAMNDLKKDLHWGDICLQQKKSIGTQTTTHVSLHFNEPKISSLCQIMDH